MIINTKFDKGEKAVIIDNDGIKTLEIIEILHDNYGVKYNLLKSKALSMMDKDIITSRREDDCFKSIQELADFYKANQ